MFEIRGKESLVEKNALLEIAAGETAVEILLIASKPFSNLIQGHLALPNFGDSFRISGSLGFH